MGEAAQHYATQVNHRASKHTWNLASFETLLTESDNINKYNMLNVIINVLVC